MYSLKNMRRDSKYALKQREWFRWRLIHAKALIYFSKFYKSRSVIVGIGIIGITATCYA